MLESYIKLKVTDKPQHCNRCVITSFKGETVFYLTYSDPRIECVCSECGRKAIREAMAAGVML